jgi:hypothetical protein
MFDKPTQKKKRCCAHDLTIENRGEFPFVLSERRAVSYK